jgi:hypothetical protein
MMWSVATVGCWCMGRVEMDVIWRFWNVDMEFCCRLRYVGINDCYKTEVRWKGVGSRRKSLPKVEFSISIYFYIQPETIHTNNIMLNPSSSCQKKLYNHETWKIFVINVINERVREKWIFWLLLTCEKVLGLYFFGVIFCTFFSGFELRTKFNVL